MVTTKSIHDDIVSPPFQFTMEFITDIYMLSQSETIQMFEEIFGKEKARQFIELSKIISPLLNVDVNKMLRLVELDKNLIELVKNTDNKIFYRPLFFPTIFINNNIEFKNEIIKGILIQEAISYDRKHETLYGELHQKYGENANDYLIFYNGIDKKSGGTFTSLFYLGGPTKREEIAKIIEEPIEYGIDLQSEEFMDMEDFIKNTIVNIIDLVEGGDEDLAITTIETSREQNIKRIQRKQIPFPTKIYIRPNERFKKYVNKFNLDNQDVKEDKIKNRISHKFLVRGHFRHFRSEFYKKVKGERKWIKPFFKGEGILIAKEYKVVD